MDVRVAMNMTHDEIKSKYMVHLIKVPFAAKKLNGGCNGNK